MTGVRPAADDDPAQWLLQADVDWWDLVRYGPPGFDVYVRIAFAEESARDEPGAEEDRVRTALETLVDHTSTPANAYAAIWEGWGGRDPVPDAPRVHIPHRAMLLFGGAVAVLRDAAGSAWSGSAQDGVEPHLAWPEDRSWCLACEVDEDIEFTVGCSIDAYEALVAALPGAVRRVGYGEQAPLHRDE
ncbi:hypothetical protein [Nocardioides aurantiacus]|uniref:hypothetical protein n=1 Tax=Nocardioides aurantiacus TaxID=86796 RepID=UPI00403F4275